MYRVAGYPQNHRTASDRSYWSSTGVIGVINELYRGILSLKGGTVSAEVNIHNAGERCVPEVDRGTPDLCCR